MDLKVYDLASALLGELTEALAHTRAGQVAQAVVHPGDTVPMYGCELAAVRVAGIAPIPLRNSGCPKEFAVTYELVVDRCYRGATDTGAMATLGVLDSAARDAYEDAGAMRKAVLCGTPAGAGSVYPGPWTARGPRGGIHGGAMTVEIRGLTLSCGCAEGAWGAGIDARIPPLAGDPRP